MFRSTNGSSIKTRNKKRGNCKQKLNGYYKTSFFEADWEFGPPIPTGKFHFPNTKLRTDDTNLNTL